MDIKHIITVSDPWDFTDSTGKNVILGAIVNIVSDRSVIFESDDILDFDGRHGRLLVLRTRYAGQTLTDENIFEGTISGSLLTSGKIEAFGKKDVDGSKYVIIGRLQPVS